MKTKLSIFIGALALVFATNQAPAQTEPQQNEAKIVLVREVKALVIKSPGGAIVRKIPVENREEYNLLRRDQSIRNQLQSGERIEPEIPDPRIEFRDSTGNVVKSISVKEEISTRTETIGNKGYIVEYLSGVSPKINSNNKFLLLSHYSLVSSYTDSDGNKIPAEGGLPSRLTYYDIQGNILFDKTLREELRSGDSGASVMSLMICRNNT